MTYAQSYLSAINNCLLSAEVTIPEGPTDLQNGLERAVTILRNVQQAGGTQLFLGNGASAAFAEHMSLDWTKNGNVRSISPSSWVLLTALSNDLSYDQAFSIYLEKHARAGDVVVTISSSGNSPNIVHALGKAREMGCQVVTLSGLKPNNSSRQLGDLNFYVPAKTYGMVECAHQVLLHMMLDAFMNIKEWDRADCQNMNIKDLRF